MIQDDVVNEYFEWLVDIAYRDARVVSYKKLLRHLHHTDFVVVDPMDDNRAEDGIKLRYRFAHGYLEEDEAEDLLSGPCSVLEMMLALSIRCEEIMEDPRFGDRTSQWFWEMISSLGLGGMYDVNFDICHVKDVLMRFLAREYEPDGSGGLFTVRRCAYDMRDMEIWHQLLEYLNSIS